MKDKARILLLITKADVGGAQIHVLELLMRLKHRYHFTLAAGEEGYLTRKAREQGISVRVLKHLKRPIDIREDRRAYRECVSLLKELNPDLLHSHSSKAGVVGRLAAWRTGTPSLFTAHGWAFTEGAPTLQRMYGLLIESLLCRLPGRVVNISEYDYKLAARYHVGWSNRRFLIRNGVSQPSGEVANKMAGTSVPKVLAVGRLSPVKNHVMLLRALAALNTPFQAKIIGEGECHALLVREIQSLGLSNKVQLAGEVTKLSADWQQADVFVLSSNYEGLPLSVLEAMSVGLPVVSTDVGGVSEAVLHQRTGLLSARADPLALAENIDILLKDLERARRYGAHGRQVYEQKFTAIRMVGQTDALYTRLLSGKLM